MNEHTEDPCRFPPLEPWDQGLLDVGDGHALHYEQCGAARGLPLLFLHGGPGSGCSPRHRRLFDPAGYRILLFDQRGCGRSTPRGGLRHNTTADLVADIERLRAHLGIDRWLVCGGSWGASLALAYCAAHKPACLGLVLRGVFLTGRRDLAWFFDEARQLLPEEFDAFAAPAPKRRRRDLLGWYRRTLEGADPQAALAAVRAWMRWEEALGRPGRRPSSATEAAIEAAAEPGAEEAERLLAKYRLQAHYLSRRCFLGEARLLDCAARLHGLPTAILHGRLDLVCRPQNAWRVHQTAHGSRLLLVDGAGHSPFDPPMAAALAGVTGHFLRQRDFAGWGRSVHERA